MHRTHKLEIDKGAAVKTTERLIETLKSANQNKGGSQFKSPEVSNPRINGE